jgi:periplasmic protein CpxP/Spy
MKNLTRSILAAAFGAALAMPAAIAQTATTDDQHKGERHARMEEHHKERMEFLAKELSLTQDQQSQIMAFHDEQKAKMQAIRANDQLSREEKKAQMKALKQERKAKMDSILTADQKAKMKELRKEHRGMHGKRGGDHGGPGR